MSPWPCDCNLGIASNPTNLSTLSCSGRSCRRFTCQSIGTLEGSTVIDAWRKIERQGKERIITHRYVPALSASSPTPRWNVMKSSRQALILIWSYHQQLLNCFNQKPITVLKWWEHSGPYKMGQNLSDEHPQRRSHEELTHQLVSRYHHMLHRQKQFTID